jgi:hypothetical protein
MRRAERGDVGDVHVDEQGGVLDLKCVVVGGELIGGRDQAASSVPSFTSPAADEKSFSP